VCYNIIVKWGLKSQGNCDTQSEVFKIKNKKKFENLLTNKLKSVIIKSQSKELKKERKNVL